MVVILPCVYVVVGGFCADDANKIGEKNEERRKQKILFVIYKAGIAPVIFRHIIHKLALSFHSDDE